jgi:hypothetical protein
MIVNSVLVTYFWREFGAGSFLYEAAPGILTGIATYFIFDAIGWNKMNEATPSKS